MDQLQPRMRAKVMVVLVEAALSGVGWVVGGGWVWIEARANQAKNLADIDGV